jgi:predicted dehydrogenase
MDPLKTAILGCGGWGTRHAENLIKLPDQIKLVAFCDTDINRAAEFGRKFGSPESQIFRDHHELFQKVKFDLLVIALPPFAHSDEVSLAAERGIHLLIEKPVALTAELAWKMVADAENAGIRTQVGFMYRFGQAIQRMKSLQREGRSGPIGQVRAGYFCNHLHAPWWRFKEKAGGQVFEQAIHLVDLMRYLAGEVETVYSLQRNLFHQSVPGGYTVEDNSGTVFSFKNGAIGVLTATNNAIPWKWTWDLKIVAQSVTAEFLDSNQATFTYTDLPDPYPGTFFPGETISTIQDDYMLELKDLLWAIQTGGQTRTPLREGALTLEVVLAAAKSAQSGQVERI